MAHAYNIPIILIFINNIVFSSVDFCVIISPIMPFPLRLPARLPAQIRQFAASVKTALGKILGGIPQKLVEKAEKVRTHAQDIINRLLEKMPLGKRHLVLIGAGGVFAALLLIFIGALLLSRDKSDKRVPAAASTSPEQVFIPHEDLFLPDEPDFVPGVMPEREQRTMWTAADAAPWWQDPLKNGEETWRSLIEKTVDEILEGVP